MSLTVNLALVFHVFIAVTVVVMVCGPHGIGPIIQHKAEKFELVHLRYTVFLLHT